MIPLDFPFLPDRQSPEGPHNIAGVKPEHLRRLENVVYHMALRRHPPRPACIGLYEMLPGETTATIRLRMAEQPIEQAVEWFVYLSMHPLAVFDESRRALTITAIGGAAVPAVVGNRPIRVSGELTIRDPVAIIAPAVREVVLNIRIDSGSEAILIMSAGLRTVPLRELP